LTHARIAQLLNESGAFAHVFGIVRVRSGSFGLVRGSLSDARMSNTTKVPAHVLRAIAVKAPCDPRTAARFIAGEPVQPMNAERIRAAIVALGLPPHRGENR
jgi:hypothetical protein